MKRMKRILLAREHTGPPGIIAIVSLPYSVHIFIGASLVLLILFGWGIIS